MQGGSKQSSPTCWSPLAATRGCGGKVGGMLRRSAGSTGRSNGKVAMAGVRIKILITPVVAFMATAGAI